MRQNENAELLIYCSRCSLRANEYNWTLETASLYSVKGRETPTFIYVLLDSARGNKTKWESFKVVCPRCHEKIILRRLTIPSIELLEEYAAEVGLEYVNSFY
jgi:hypothetical protein